MNMMFTRNLRMKMNADVIVIGGGAAGMMAAGTAAQQGKSVILLERNTRLGRKLLITGKGRCNVTNDCGEEEFLRNIPTNPKFLYGAIHRFGTGDVKAFFEERGVPLKTERGNRVFPISDKAADITTALERYCAESGVKTVVGRAAGLSVENGKITGVLCADGRSLEADAVILATGGKSYPLTGSSGDGYAIAASVGHTVTAIRPSLVPLVSKDRACADMQGLSLKNVAVSLLPSDSEKVIYRELGEMLFTHFGLSGPLILSASAHIKRGMERCRVRIDLKPGLTEQQLDARLLRDFAEFANRDYANALEKLLPRKMIPVIVERSGIPPMEKVNQVTKEQRTALCRLLKGLEISVDGFRPIEEAIITSGGICVKEINPGTMESKLVQGLYFAGEVIDVDGYTGGFNLQIAFSTGYTAGCNC